MDSCQSLQRLKMCSGFGYCRSDLLAIIYNDYSHRGRSNPDCRTLGSSTKKECGGNSEDGRVVLLSRGVSKPAWLCIAVCRSQAYQIQIQIQNQFAMRRLVQAKNRNRRHETRLFVSYRIVKGQGFYQPRRHRPLVGPYAVPKRIPVIAGSCWVLRICLF